MQSSELGLFRRGTIDTQKRTRKSTAKFPNPQLDATLDDCYPGWTGQPGQPCTKEPLRDERTPGPVAGSPRSVLDKTDDGDEDGDGYSASTLVQAIPRAVGRVYTQASNGDCRSRQLLLEGAPCSFRCMRPPQPPPLRECFAEARRTAWKWPGRCRADWIPFGRACGCWRRRLTVLRGGVANLRVRRIRQRQSNRKLSKLTARKQCRCESCGSFRPLSAGQCFRRCIWPVYFR